jgi:2-dehydro-3-deoxyphosphogalactonate aldolase
VLDAATMLLPVGGITPDNMAAYRAAGASGFGLGSALYKPEQDVATTTARARAFIAAWDRSAGG